MNARILLILALIASAPAAAAEPTDVVVHRKLAMLCAELHVSIPGGPPLPCRPEQMATASTGDINKAMDGFWAYWNEVSPRTGASLKANLDRAYLAKYPPPPHRYSTAELQSLSVTRLCGLMRSKNQSSESAGAELMRKGFTADELRLVKTQSIEVGMSQQALLCAWGDPMRRNRTVTAGGERIQWVYNGPTFVYTTDGIITAYQD